MPGVTIAGSPDYSPTLEHFGRCEEWHCDFLHDCGDPETKTYMEHSILYPERQRRKIRQRRRLMEAARKKRRLEEEEEQKTTLSSSCMQINGVEYCPAAAAKKKSTSGRKLSEDVNAETPEQRKARKLTEHWEE